LGARDCLGQLILHRPFVYASRASPTPIVPGSNDANAASFSSAAFATERSVVSADASDLAPCLDLDGRGVLLGHLLRELRDAIDGLQRSLGGRIA